MNALALLFLTWANCRNVLSVDVCKEREMISECLRVVSQVGSLPVGICAGGFFCVCVKCVIKSLEMRKYLYPAPVHFSS